MIANNVCADAVFDPGWISQPDYVNDLSKLMITAGWDVGTDAEVQNPRATYVLETLTLAEAIEFIEPQYTKET